MPRRRCLRCGERRRAQAARTRPSRRRAPPLEHGGAGRLGARRGRHRAHRLRRRDGLQRERDRGDGAPPRRAVLPEAAGASTRSSRSSSCGSSSRIDYRKLEAAHVPDPRRRSRLCSCLRRSGSGTARATRIGGSRSGRSTSSPPRWPSSASSSGSRTRSRRRPTRIKSFSVGFLPHLIVVGVLMLALPEAARLRQRRRAPVPHVHAALRGGRAAAVHRRVHGAARHRRARRSSASATTATRGTSRGSTWTTTARTSPTSPSSPS